MLHKEETVYETGLSMGQLTMAVYFPLPLPLPGRREFSLSFSYSGEPD